MKFRRLIKDVTTGLYYDGRGGWTTEVAQAHDYVDTAAAVKAAIHMDPKNLHLVLKFPDARMDVSHPLGGKPPKPGNHGTTANILMAGLFPAVMTAARIIRGMSS
jgi:hypothetical protein